MGNRLIYPLVITNSLPWKDPPFLSHQDTSVDPPRWLLRMKGQEAGRPKSWEDPRKKEKSWENIGKSWEKGSL